MLCKVIFITSILFLSMNIFMSYELRNLLNGTVLHNRKCNALPALSDVRLIEDRLTILRYKVCKHAGEYSTVKTYPKCGETRQHMREIS